MTDAHLMDADCVHGTVWFECVPCTAAMEADLNQLAGQPRFPKAIVDMRQFARVDAYFHSILEGCAALRRAGATEAEVSEYRAAATSDPWTTTAAWCETRAAGSGS